MAAVSANRVLIYGGRGALGSTCVHHFKSQGWWVANIDIGANEEADANVHVKICDNFCEHAEQVTSDVAQLLGDQKVDAIVCVAGGWAGGNCASKDVFKSSDLMWKQSVWTSTISTYLASHHLKPGGLLTLTGAKASLSGTPGMVGYGMAKAAVHQLCESVAGQNSGLPAGAVAVAILPVTLDTPMNRKFMPNADFSSWTPLEYIAEQGEKCSMGKIYGFGHKVAVMFFQRLMFYSWATGSERPASGSLIQLVTSGGKTEATPVQ